MRFVLDPPVKKFTSRRSRFPGFHLLANIRIADGEGYMANVRAHRLAEVVDRIYGAVGDPNSWGDVLQEVAETVGARGALLFKPSSTASETQGFWSPSTRIARPSS